MNQFSTRITINAHSPVRPSDVMIGRVRQTTLAYAEYGDPAYDVPRHFNAQAGLYNFNAEILRQEISAHVWGIT